jgi:hypothetical protein
MSRDMESLLESGPPIVRLRSALLANLHHLVPALERAFLDVPLGRFLRRCSFVSNFCAKNALSSTSRALDAPRDTDGLVIGGRA